MTQNEYHLKHHMMVENNRKKFLSAVEEFKLITKELRSYRHKIDVEQWKYENREMLKEVLESQNHSC